MLMVSIGHLLGHLFAHMWHWDIVRNIWRGSGTELHEYVHMLLHLQQFLIRR